MTDQANIEGLKLIYQTGGQRIADDPFLPFKLEVNLRPPEFIRGMTKEAVLKFVEVNEFRTHPRLRHLTISGPDGVIEKVERQ